MQPRRASLTICQVAYLQRTLYLEEHKHLLYLPTSGHRQVFQIRRTLNLQGFSRFSSCLTSVSVLIREFREPLTARFTLGMKAGGLRMGIPGRLCPRLHAETPTFVLANHIRSG